MIRPTVQTYPSQQKAHDGVAGFLQMEAGCSPAAPGRYNATSAVTVRLKQGTATGGDGNDTLIGIENIHGSFTYGDDLQGDDGANFDPADEVPSDRWNSLQQSGAVLAFAIAGLP